MANEKRKNLTPVQQEYHLFEKERETKRPVLKNCLRAFLIGGLICAIGQAISYFYMYFFDFTEQTAGNPTAAKFDGVI